MSLRYILLLGILLLPGLLRAQPDPEATWLAVKVLTAEGKPLPESFRFTCSLLPGEGKKGVPGRLERNEKHWLFMGVAPGTYTLQCLFQSPVRVLQTKVIELHQGQNVVDWRLPALTAVVGRLTLGTALVAPKTIYGLLQGEGVGKAAAVTPCVVQPTKDGYRLAGVWPGRYRLWLFTDAGYGMAELEAPEAATEVTLPLTLQPGGRMTLPALPDAKLPLTYQLSLRGAHEKIPLSLLLIGDSTKPLVSPHLPPGNWQWRFLTAPLLLTRGVVRLKTAGEEVEVGVEGPKGP
jgi:hypothetical protein